MIGHFPFHFNWNRPHRTKHERTDEEKQHRRDRELKGIDRICMIFSIIMPLTAIPQIHLIFTTHNVSGISLLMWIFYCIGVIPFLVFGILHRERQLIILNTLWLIMQGIVIAGILMYR